MRLGLRVLTEDSEPKDGRFEELKRSTGKPPENTEEEEPFMRKLSLPTSPTTVPSVGQ